MLVKLVCRSDLTLSSSRLRSSSLISLHLKFHKSNPMIAFICTMGPTSPMSVNVRRHLLPPVMLPDIWASPVAASIPPLLLVEPTMPLWLLSIEPVPLPEVVVPQAIAPVNVPTLFDVSERFDALSREKESYVGPPLLGLCNLLYVGSLADVSRGEGLGALLPVLDLHGLRMLDCLLGTSDEWPLE